MYVNRVKSRAKVVNLNISCIAFFLCFLRTSFDQQTRKSFLLMLQFGMSSKKEQNIAWYNYQGETTWHEHKQNISTILVAVLCFTRKFLDSLQNCMSSRKKNPIMYLILLCIRHPFHLKRNIKLWYIFNAIWVFWTDPHKILTEDIEWSVA